jgi:chromosome segregation ATPase
MQRLEDHAESLKDALETTVDGQLDALKLVVKEIETEVQNHQLSLEEGKSASDAVFKKVTISRKDLERQIAELATLEQKCKVAKEEQERVGDKRHQILSEKNTAISRIDGAKRLRDEIREKRDHMVAKVLQSIEGASIITPRVPVDEGETTDSLGAKMAKLKADLQRYSQQ